MFKLKSLVAATFRLRSLEQQKEGIKMRKLKSLGLLVVVVVCISAVSVFSAVPLRINYQGRYTENGTPVTGNRWFVFKIVDSDGDPVYWTSGSVSINLQNGLFNYVLEPTGVDWPNVEPYFEVSVGPSAGEETLLSPRERINASAYAIYASSASYAFNALQSNVNSTLQSGVTLFIDGEISTTGEAVTISTNVVVKGKVNILETGSSPAYYTILKGGDQTGNVTYTLPTSSGAAGNILTTDDSGNLSWTSTGAGDVTAASNITDNRIVKGDGGAKGVQESLVTIDDTGHVFPNSGSAQDLGTSTTYWANTYTNKLYLNPTAYLDGATAGTILSSANYIYLVGNAGVDPWIGVRENAATGRSIRMVSDATNSKTYVMTTYGTGGAFPLSLRMIATDVLTVGTDYGVNIGAGTAATALGQLGLDRLYLNSTAYLDGTTANRLCLYAGSQGIYFNINSAWAGLWDTTGLYPYTDSAQTLGNASYYWSNTYTDRLYFSSTVYEEAAGVHTNAYGGRYFYTDATADASAYVMYLMRSNFGTGVMYLGFQADSANYGYITIGTDASWQWSLYTGGAWKNPFKIGGTGVYPVTDSAYTSGDINLYWSNTFTDRVTLNSTVYLDGTTLADPNADQIMMWDDSASLVKFMAIGNGLNINATPVLAADTASDTVDGVVELATIAETTTGTDATRAVTPDGLAGSNYGKRVVCIKVIGETIALTTGDGQAFFTVPTELNGYNLVDADASVYTVSTSGLPTIQIARIRGTVDMLSTKITIDASEFTSYTAATQPVINTANDDVLTADFVRVDVDGAGTGTKGLDVILTFQLP